MVKGGEAGERSARTLDDPGPQLIASHHGSKPGACARLGSLRHCVRSAEQLSDVLGSAPILGRDTVGVVAGHVHGRPSQACLLLGLADHRVQGGGVEVAERMPAAG